MLRSMAILPTLLLEHPIRQIRLIYPNLHITRGPILLLQQLDQVTLQTLQDQQDTLRALQVKLGTHLTRLAQQGIHHVHIQLDILRMTPAAPVIRQIQLRATPTHNRVGKVGYACCTLSQSLP